MAKALYLKWRPSTWSEVVGQQHIVETLKNAVAADRVAHAQLLSGPRGTGKTSVARILGKAVNCLHEELSERPDNTCENCVSINDQRFLDIIEIDAASNTSVDDVRDLREKINFSPNKGRFKVYIIDEVHMLSTAAFNALLKTLEEPPAHAMFVLATTEVHKIPATVLSRCQRHDFRRIPVKEIVGHLQELVKDEKIDAETSALALIARQATGSMRDAISLLDQLASTSEKITMSTAQEVLGTVTEERVLALVDALNQRDTVKALNQVHGAVDSGSDIVQYTRQIVGYLRKLLLVKTGNADMVDEGKEVREQMAAHASTWSTNELLRLLDIFSRATVETKNAWLPSLPIEIAVIEAIETDGPKREIEGGSTPQYQENNKTKRIADKPKPKKQLKNTKAKKNQPELRGAEKVPGNVIRQWKEIIQATRKHSPQTQGLLNSCTPMGIKNNVLILGFSSDFARIKMEKGEHVLITEKVIEQVTNEPLKVKCITANPKGNEIPPDVDHNGLVATLVRDFGGEVVGKH